MYLFVVSAGLPTPSLLGCGAYAEPWANMPAFREQPPRKQAVVERDKRVEEQTPRFKEEQRQNEERLEELRRQKNVGEMQRLEQQHKERLEATAATTTTTTEGDMQLQQQQQQLQQQQQQQQRSTSDSVKCCRKS